jgi:hypothetical protein
MLVWRRALEENNVNPKLRYFNPFKIFDDTRSRFTPPLRLGVGKKSILNL